MRQEYSIGGVFHPSFNSANTVSIDIFLSGCLREPKCKGCHNPELWDRTNGVEMDYLEIMGLILNAAHNSPWLKSVCIMGGEPLHAPNLSFLLKEIKQRGYIVWLYTSYELHEIPTEIKEICDFIKTGRYIETLKVEGERLASSNQKIYHNMGDGTYEIYYSIK
jgi:anaerobic ribonucleoside-triphosphate reductase activating protein